MPGCALRSQWPFILIDMIKNPHIPLFDVINDRERQIESERKYFPVPMWLIQSVMHCCIQYWGLRDVFAVYAGYGLYDYSVVLYVVTPSHSSSLCDYVCKSLLWVCACACLDECVQACILWLFYWSTTHEAPCVWSGCPISNKRQMVQHIHPGSSQTMFFFSVWKCGNNCVQTQNINSFSQRRCYRN